jgi:excisionase family DNA binding protein
MERLLTVEEVASWLQISKRTVRQWVQDEYIPFLKIGALVRFVPHSIREWLKKRETTGRTARRLTVELD